MRCAQRGIRFFSVAKASEDMGRLGPAQQAFVSRFGYGLSDLKPEYPQNVLNHPSVSPGNSSLFYRYVSKGSGLVHFFVYEHLAVKYPRLPLKNLHHSHQQYLGRDLMQHVIATTGISHALIGLPPTDPLSDGSGFSIYLESIMAILGCIAEHHHQGLAQLRSFVDENVMNRMIERSRLLHIPTHPKRWLYALMKRLKEPIPVYRMEGETGRQSNSPMFLAGVYTEGENSSKLGEGYGPSIRVAENRAARNALERYYLASGSSSPPSDTLFSRPFAPIPVMDTPAYPLITDLLPTHKK